MKPKATDLLELIEAGYQIDIDERSWLLGLVAAAQPLVDPSGAGLLVATCRATGDGLTIGSVVTGGIAEGSASEALSRLRASHPSLRAGADSTGQGVVVWALGDDAVSIATTARAAWSRATAHLAKAFSLRRQLGTSSAVDAGAEPTVLARLAGGAGATTRRHAGDHTVSPGLRAAAVAIDRSARRPHGRPTAALWDALTAGRWRIVDRFELEGRRYLIATPTDPDGGTGLSALERRVLALRAEGHPLKLIAFELELSVSTVSRMLARGMAVLGVRSTAELAALFA